MTEDSGDPDTEINHDPARTASDISCLFLRAMGTYYTSCQSASDINNEMRN